ncbi:hypothetical protein AALB51_08370 [Lachnospiraceae bacterium 62-26]|jgi:hypothetical protein
MKMRKLVALATAAALCLGMSLTAFAADEKENSPAEIEYGTSEDGSMYVKSDELTSEQKKEIADAAEKALKDQYNVTGKDVVVIGVGDYTLYNEDGTEIKDGKVPNGGANFNFILGRETKDGYAKGATIYVAHQKADGTWEIIEGTLDKNMYGEWVVKVKMDSFSPVAFLKVMSNGKVVEVDKKGEPVKAATTRSPKTGE